ncbi:GtrA family protein [Natronobacterium gregoryi]|uniref:GtrA family protein n=2 Tax=Natronobacterium gregoryi TaxID=44930 RepID=L0AFW1_NATGS|nr:GtrA family protein [Natronobacterium gregoryi]AFZ72037.1 putative membrane protein [Natronobacterium gregoryi SP2]ELY62688.1 GtrA family protein [Natronobacterium gregoryi SP2]PLK20885.1 GtrA family protein [Natronobacterium gregoryi SP2]SFJ20425.1 Putative flippase GtrA (transmembrane translocase of bactoprenol-linked glucose) [Natronobacterium gregoryi]
MTDSLLEATRARARALVSVTRFGQFAGVGVVGATVDNGVLLVLVELAEMGFITAKGVAWVIAIAVIFGINEAWTFSTFGGTSLRALLERLSRSYTVRFSGFLVTLAVYTALIEFLAVWYLLANVIGIGVGFIVNYTFESLFTWKVHRE